MDYSIHKIKFDKSVKQKEQKKIIKVLLNKKIFDIKNLKKSNDVNIYPENILSPNHLKQKFIRNLLLL